MPGFDRPATLSKELDWIGFAGTASLNASPGFGARHRWMGDRNRPTTCAGRMYMKRACRQDQSSSHGCVVREHRRRDQS